jgi:hypothetical protein
MDTNVTMYRYRGETTPERGKFVKGRRSEETPRTRCERVLRHFPCPRPRGDGEIVPERIGSGKEKVETLKVVGFVDVERIDESESSLFRRKKDDFHI